MYKYKYMKFLNGCASTAKCDAYGSNVEKNKDISEV